jgi:hypothetical protein
VGFLVPEGWSDGRSEIQAGGSLAGKDSSDASSTGSRSDGIGFVAFGSDVSGAWFFFGAGSLIANRPSFDVEENIQEKA